MPAVAQTQSNPGFKYRADLAGELDSSTIEFPFEIPFVKLTQVT